MEISSLVGGIIGGALGGSAFAKFLIDAAKERWMESVKAQSATELARLQDSLLSTQKALQARLDQGAHVTQAQYDLELASYKDLWTAMSELRERWRSLFVPLDFQVPGVENPWIAQALEENGKAVTAAYDAAVMVTGRLAPFYEKSIQTAARNILTESHSFILKFNQWNRQPDPPRAWSRQSDRPAHAAAAVHRRYRRSAAKSTLQPARPRRRRRHTGGNRRPPRIHLPRRREH